MAKLDLHLELNSAAFDNGPGPLEVTRILRDLADRIDQGSWAPEVPILIRDHNGNTVGSALVQDDE